jgi:hypothetical protein
MKEFRPEPNLVMKGKGSYAAGGREAAFAGDLFPALHVNKGRPSDGTRS